MEIGKNVQINLEFLPFKKAFVPSLVFFDLLPASSIIFHVKIQLFLLNCLIRDLDPDPPGSSLFGFLDPDPHPQHCKKYKKFCLSFKSDSLMDRFFSLTRS